MLLMMLRARARRPAAAGDFDDAASTSGDAAGASSAPLLDPAVEIVRAAVRRLPQRERDALFLRHYLDFDYVAIAQAMGIEVGTVSAMLHAARVSLADNLQEVAR